MSDVRLSTRMKSSPACLVGDENAMSLQMEQLMRTMGQNVSAGKRILELNPEHPVVQRLMALAQTDDARVEDFAIVLYNQALLLDGGTPDDIGKFARLLDGIMNMALESNNF